MDFCGTKDTKNNIAPTFEEHSLVLDKAYKRLYYSLKNAEEIVYKMLWEHTGGSDYFC